MPAVIAVSNITENAASLHVEQRTQHAAEVNAIVCAAAVLYGRQHGDHRGSYNEPFHLDWEDVEDDCAFRKKKTVCNEYSENRAGRADGDLRACGIQNGFEKAAADSTEKKEFRKRPAAPQPLQICSKHPKSKHVKENVKHASVEKDVRHYLPQVELMSNLVGYKAELVSERRSAGDSIKDLQQKNRAADNDQSFDDGADAAWTE